MPYSFPTPRQQRLDPIHRKRGPAPLLGDDFDKWTAVIKQELEQASIQQLAALALRFIEIATPALETYAAERYNLYLTIYWEGVPAVYEAIKTAPTEEDAHQIDVYELLGSPEQTHDLQRDLEAWLPDDALHAAGGEMSWADPLTIRQQILLIYFQVLQLLTRYARYFGEEPVESRRSALVNTIFLCTLWLALIPAALHQWPGYLQRQFLWPELGIQIDEPEQDLSDVSGSVLESVNVMRDSIFGEPWVDGLEKVWREINGTIPFRG